jgi:hypothetical protein
MDNKMNYEEAINEFDKMYKVLDGKIKKAKDDYYSEEAITERYYQKIQEISKKVDELIAKQESNNE